MTSRKISKFSILIRWTLAITGMWRGEVFAISDCLVIICCGRFHRHKNCRTNATKPQRHLHTISLMWLSSCRWNPTSYSRHTQIPLWDTMNRYNGMRDAYLASYIRFSNHKCNLPARSTIRTSVLLLCGKHGMSFDIHSHPEKLNILYLHVRVV